MASLPLTGDESLTLHCALSDTIAGRRRRHTLLPPGGSEAPGAPIISSVRELGGVLEGENFTWEA